MHRTAPVRVKASRIRRFNITGSLFVPLLFLLLCPVPNCLALQVENLLVVYNNNLAESKGLALYYGEQRRVPADNLIGLPLPAGEYMTRDDFEQKLAAPLRQKIHEDGRLQKIEAMVLIYGVPLKVGPQNVLPADWLDVLGAQMTTLAAQINTLLDRLDAILQLPASDAPDIPSQEQLQQRWRRVEEQLPGWQQKHGSGPDFPAQSAEVQTLLIRLNGLAPMARNLIQSKGENLDPASLDRLILVSSLFDQQLGLFAFNGVTDGNLLSALSLQHFYKGLLGAYAFLHDQKQLSPIEESSASVDSELTLLKRSPLRSGRWLANPFLSQFERFAGIEHLRRETLMVCRLDGPSPGIVKRMIEDSLAIEEQGLTGSFYIDARGLAASSKAKDYYAEYDRHLQLLYDQIKDTSPLPVVFDDRQELFEAGAKLPAALYVGWYSLADYVDAFDWQRGAVGFHVASAEASTLRKADSNVWCKRMLEKGVAATLGPTEEPYLQSFPLPDQFFPLLLAGQLPLIEIFYRTLPSLSWRQVLIGDPLYRPFKNKPQKQKA